MFKNNDTKKSIKTLKKPKKIDLSYLSSLFTCPWVVAPRAGHGNIKQ